MPRKMRQSTYTIRLNNRHTLAGHVLSGRYKAQLVEGSGNGYLRTACDYVHLNPIRAKLLGAEDRLLSYPWSSFPWYLAGPQPPARVAAGGPAPGGAWDTAGHARVASGVRASHGAAPVGG